MIKLELTEREFELLWDAINRRCVDYRFGCSYEGEHDKFYNELRALEDKLEENVTYD